MSKWLLKTVPWCVLAVFAADILALLLPRPDKDFQRQEFGRLPVLLNGRVQPLDSVGRNALLQIRGTASVPLAEKKAYQFWKHPPKLRATEWLMEVMMKPDLAATRPIFLIHHPDLLNELGLRGKGREKSGLFYFTYHELTNCLEQIEREGRQVAGIETAARTAYQKQVAKLHHALSLYRRLQNSLQPEDSRDFAAELAGFQQAIAPGLAALKAQQAGREFDAAALNRLVAYLRTFEEMARRAYPLLVPPDRPGATHADWRNMGQALFEAGVHGGPLPPPVTWLAAMATAYGQNHPAAFNRALDQYRAWLADRWPTELRKGRAEFFYNQLQAFLHAMIIYLCAFVLAAGAMLTLAVWPTASEILRRSALLIATLALLVHTAGLLFRMWLERRPPVTNLYSSAVFIGWMAVVLGLVLERIYRMGIGVAVSALIGFVTLIIAHNLALGGDTMEMLRAVLDTNFWLATHVITITLGYAAMFLAGGLAGVYILTGVFTPLLGWKAAPAASPSGSRSAAPAKALQTATLGQALGRMVYGILCFATLFSFVGTVLGGIWADQSWGRFWGWDPKENGALLIVLWCAVILHARADGLVQDRGVMNLAVFGNVITCFSWFGVNMLGIGLHSYGFMDAAFRWILIFTCSQLAIIGLGALPLRFWASFRPAPGPGGPIRAAPVSPTS